MTTLADSERAEIIITSARLRAELALREARRALFGDAEYVQELRESKRIDWEMRHEPPPPPEVRKRLKRWYGWKKRGG